MAFTADTALAMGERPLSMPSAWKALSLPVISVFPKGQWPLRVLWWAPLPSARTRGSEIPSEATSCLLELLFLERASGKWQNKNIQGEPLCISPALGSWSDGTGSGRVYAVCEAARPIWSPGVRLAPESKTQILVTRQSRSTSPTFVPQNRFYSLMPSVQIRFYL